MDFPAWGSLLTTHWPVDWIIIGAFTAFVALDAMRSGSTRAVSLALGLPTAMLIVQELPKAFILGSLTAPLVSPLAQVGIFVATAIVLYIAIHRVISPFSTGIGPAQALVVGLAATAVLIVVWLELPAFDAIWHFGPQVQAVFGEAYRFWWLLAAYVALATVRS